MSTINHPRIADRLTQARLASYLEATGGDIAHAIALYDWNIRAAEAIYGDLGRLEVVFRNAIDAALLAYGTAQGWPQVWYRRPQLFPGEAGRRSLRAIQTAERRAVRLTRQTSHGQLIAGLSFGFWPDLCVPAYLTSLWVPALVGAFPGHPTAGQARQVRAAVSSRMQRLHYLRNRIAHHEPIHRRDLASDHWDLVELVGWICGDCSAWIHEVTRVPQVLDARP